MSGELVSVASSEIARSWPKKIYIGGGMCAGVVRAQEAYRDFTRTHERGTVYSVGEPAHNPHVNQEFIDLGVIFVDSMNQVPKDEDANVIEQPHGNTPEDEEIAQGLGGDYVFTECPLVTKVKKEIIENTAQGLQTIYYGQLSKDENDVNKPHPETRAAMSVGNVLLVTSLDEALSDDLYDQIIDPTKVAFACQTTHDAEEAVEMAEALKEQLFPDIKIPKKPDYCYATHDRQGTAKRANEFKVDRIVVLGDEETSSNTRNLAKVAAKDLKKGGRVIVVNSISEVDEADFHGVDSVAIIGSASTPIEQINLGAQWFTDRGSDAPQNIDIRDESRIRFPPPIVHRTAAPFVPEIIWENPTS